MCSICYLCEEEVETVNHLFLSAGLLANSGEFSLLLGVLLGLCLTKLHIIFTVGKKQEWELQIKMEDCPSMYLVDWLERKKC